MLFDVRNDFFGLDRFEQIPTGQVIELLGDDVADGMQVVAVESIGLALLFKASSIRAPMADSVRINRRS